MPCQDSGDLTRWGANGASAAFFHVVNPVACRHACEGDAFVAQFGVRYATRDLFLTDLVGH